MVFDYCPMCLRAHRHDVAAAAAKREKDDGEEKAKENSSFADKAWAALTVRVPTTSWDHWRDEWIWQSLCECSEVFLLSLLGSGFPCSLSLSLSLFRSLSLSLSVSLPPLRLLCRILVLPLDDGVPDVRVKFSTFCLFLE